MKQLFYGWMLSFSFMFINLFADGEPVHNFHACTVASWRTFFI